jgi:hypothetical protein
MFKFLMTFVLTITTSLCYAQTVRTQSLDSLNRVILELNLDVNNIKINLGRVEQRFKTGIVVSTIGYSTVIAGGLMLGRKNDDVGKALLVTGGACGVTGTILMLDAFKFLGVASGKDKRSKT